MKHIVGAAAAAWVCMAGGAGAQTEIAAGQSVSGELGAASQRDGDGRPYDCYFLKTEPETAWEVSLQGSFDTYLAVGRGADCASATAWDVTNDDSGFLGTSLNSRIRFASGGGAYLIKATAYSSSGQGAYTLTIDQTGTTSYGLLPPGEQIFEPVAGQASIIPGPNSPEGFAPGTTFSDCAGCPMMVALPSGQYMMGSPAEEEGREQDEGPRHAVTIGRPFAMGQFEVTFDEYNACVAAGGCRSTPSDMGWGQGRRPVINVTYEDAQRYAVWLSRTTGQNYFIPSEAEWEYAARAGSDTPWNTGDAIITDDANFLGTFGKTVVVGAYPPNAFGLHDMHGNVWEWTQDCLDTGYLGVPVDGSANMSGDCEAQRILRGGSYDRGHADLRSASRHSAASSGAYVNAGFRVARSM